ncbi:FAD-dependent oxidoreductase [Allopusillimonas soli]|uniref:FAD-dependent oxidoreductase n=1 Tax=Allopusillimonas soli TaxID=659016 RepID=A0A853FER8_9BURK|nr:FAD-dependent oxidoreductase [Allopusillimonas soli]NYT38407.1 FAD-dependent oxidoreductase [Allopusillimonas soli]TEA72031.1 FAD-dependent oxidoreductase [Allopusillimonas soli]
MHIAIVGAGALGRLLAYLLSRQPTHRISVFDPADGPEGRGAAGWTAAGMLTPTAELECADLDVFNHGLRSLELWSRIMPSLPGDVSFARDGSLLLAHRHDSGAAQRTVGLLKQKAPQPYRPVALLPAQLAELEPDIHGPSLAWMLPGEGVLNAVETMRGLYSAAADKVTWHWNHTITQVAPGLVGNGTQSWTFDHVFDARGLGQRPPGMSSSDNALSCQNVRGVRGEIFWLHAPGVVLNRPARLLHPRHRVYVVPRRNDIIVVGASEIESEDRSPVSLRSTVELLAAAHSMMPGLAEARLVHTETNLRPALVDNLPRIEHEPGLTRINGLFRHGWLIAPAIAEKALAQALPDNTLIQVSP